MASYTPTTNTQFASIIILNIREETVTALGRKTPPDFYHVAKYPFTVVAGIAVPVVFGLDWYEGFDTPVKGSDGRWRISISGGVRGGHCICAEPLGAQEQDSWAWHVFYDQGVEGACTGFGTSRAFTLHKRRTYDAFWLYDDARRIDGNYPDGEGAYVRDAFQAAKQWGDHFEDGAHCVRSPWNNHTPGNMIKAYHWITDANAVRTALGYASTVGEIPLLNSWGTSYPETVYISLDNVQTLLDHEGECGVPIF